MGDRTKRAIVTGGGSGLGRAICLRLAREGWAVAVADIDHVGGAETVELVRAAGAEGHLELVDVTCLSQWQALRGRLAEKWSDLDLLVNNAGVCGAGEVGIYPAEDWRWLIDVNLWGPIYGCHTFVDWLKRNPGGAHIINVASIAAIASAGLMGSYSVSKAGVVALSETLYAELKPHGVGVTVICAGFFASKLLQQGRWSSDRAREQGELMVERSQFTADELADVAVRAIRSKKLYVVHGWRARLAWRLKRMMPRGFHRLTALIYKRSIVDHAEQLPGK